MSALELAANVVMTLSIALAARNNVHTWWTGILGCVLFGALFLQARLYADATLQVFFIATSIAGWLHWVRGADAGEAPVSRAPARTLILWSAAAVLVTALYGTLLARLTDAYAPFADSAVLTVSVVAQLLLMQRKLETWPAWLIVNSIAVPLFASRGLHLTSALYAAYWFNALYGGWRWRRQWLAAVR